MSKIMIIGVGRVGQAAAKLLRFTTGHTVVLVDASVVSLTSALVELEATPTALMPGSLVIRSASDETVLERIFEQERPDLVICSTPFSVNIQVARLAAQHRCHYIDFTEDDVVTDVISQLDVGSATFVPQTGLAPGLVTYLGLDLFTGLGKPKELKLRVGALPQSNIGPGHYAITWSPEGLINEYLKPARRKLNHRVESTGSLNSVEDLVIGATRYEAFTTAGGVGNLAAYEGIPSVNYKTLRYPGHLSFMRNLLLQLDFDFQAGVKTIRELFPVTREDVIVLLAAASDEEGEIATFGAHFYPDPTLNLTALELTTAGTGVAVVELILKGSLPSGVVLPSAIKLADLAGTAAHALVMARCEFPRQADAILGAS